MRQRLIRLLAVLVSVLALGVALAAPAVASTPRTACVPVYLTGEGEATSATTTTATLMLLGRPIATTTGAFTPTGGTGFTGEVVITPKRLRGGTLVVTVTGNLTFDSTGAPIAFDAEGPVVGTGVLEGVSGTLRFFGPQTGTKFTEKVTGRLCTDLSRW